jgi:hypothetical protein
VGELERPTHYHRKMMVTASFKGTGEYIQNILPQSRSWTQTTLLDKSLVDWKMSAISKREIPIKENDPSF